MLPFFIQASCHQARESAQPSTLSYVSSQALKLRQTTCWLVLCRRCNLICTLNCVALRSNGMSATPCGVNKTQGSGSMLFICFFLQALLAWYQDMLAALGANSSRVSPPKPPATPFGKLQLNTPVKHTRSSAALPAAAAAGSPPGSITSPLAHLGINTPKTKRKGAAAAEAEEEAQVEQVAPA